MRNISKRTVRVVFAGLLVTYLATHFLGHAHAQSSLGIGTNEAVMPATGMFAGTMTWINAWQQSFYHALTGALRAMREGDGSAAWLLVGLSFGYGVFHAAGPGHGKAVISSYMLANEVALRRGILLSFLSSFLQGLTAIVAMTVIFAFLRGTAAMTQASHVLEVASYALVTLFGLWLLWRKALPRLSGVLMGRRAHALSSAVSDHGHDHHHAHDHAHHHHHADEVCATCGHSHAPDPRLLAGERFDWKSAWAAVASVGIRPCTGALIVLSFALLNGLWIAGILSVIAMSIGTAITVSALAILAVTAKNWAVAIGGDGRIGNRIHATIEVAGALFVFVIGATLLTASLSA